MGSLKKKKFDADEYELDIKSPTQDNEEKKKEKEEKVKVETVGLFEMFKFSDSVDKLLLFLGIVFSVVCGMAFPLMFMVFGDLGNVFATQGVGGEDADKKFMDGVIEVVWKMCAIGGGMWVSHYIFVACLNYAAERQVLRVRKEFFKAVLRQDLAWYDTTTTSEFATRMTEDLNKLQDGIGEKLGMLLRFIVTGLGCFILPFLQNWRISLVLSALIPIMVIMGGVMGYIMSTAAKGEMDTYGKAGAIAEEVLSSIRTVVAFGGQQKEIENYKVALKDAKKHSIIKGTLTMSTIGLMFGLVYAAYGVGFWYGLKLILDYRVKLEYVQCLGQCLNITDISDIDDINYTDIDPNCLIDCDKYTIGSVTTAIFSILNGGMQIGQSSMYVEAVQTARAAAVTIFRVIDRKPVIDSSSSQGKKPAQCTGSISFNNVGFSYPARKDVTVLDGFDLDIAAGSTVALVGSSGCGKSTCVQLVQRMYDPDQGQVMLDGQDVKEINVGWLRDNIGVVGQEPVLFDCSILENIKLAKQDATVKEIEDVCRQANAYEFISKLPQGLDTMVGEGGAQLSGGQKQRIAIARALIRNPKILLLDEATSALDNQSEAIVQAALDKIDVGRTTIIVAHRLTTVRNADMIVTLEGGRVRETGTHEELMARQGLYFSLVNRQLAGKDDDSSKELQLIEKDDEKIPNGNKENGLLKRNQSTKQVSIKSQINTIEMANNKQSKLTLIGRLMKMNKPELIYILIGCVFSVAFGAMTPLFGTLFGDVMNVFIPTIDIQEQRDEMVKYALYFGGIGAGFLLSQVIIGFTFSLSGARLVERVRGKMFSSMLSQEIGWYDLEENNTGALCARLSASAEAVHSATGGKIGQVVSGVSILVLSSVLSLLYEWRLGLVTMVFLPPLILGMVMQIWYMVVDGAVQKTALEKSAKVAVEAINNIRTVAGLRCEDHLHSEYCLHLNEPHKLAKRKAHIRGFIYGFANSNFMFAYSICYYYGAWLIINDPDSGITTDVVWKIAIMVLNGGAMIGMSLTALMDINNAFAAAEKIFQVLDRKPKIDTNPSAGLKLDKISGETGIDEGVFSYPTRKNIKILKKLSLDINKGEKVALVGQSGCGKSTVIQMIQRFYDFDDGSMQFDNNDIRNLNLPFVRSKLGIVSQEPVLFNKSIAENIKYGDNDRDIPMNEIIEAARKANIHNFVSSLPQGYETNVGGKGTQLSGGQKQRVAIARALVRNPSIILLDEATSALDTESEKIVQEALETAQVGRTSITIAHRLSTIMDSDKIFVLERGQVTEVGSHSELLAKRGVYYNLWNKSAAV